MREEIEPTLSSIPGIKLKAYRERLSRRYMNPALQHRAQQIAMDGSQKLPQRLLCTVRDRLRGDAPIDRLALAVAGWLHYLRGMDEAGRAYTIEDPLAEALAEHVTRARQMCASMTDVERAEQCFIEKILSFHQVFGELSHAPGFVRAMARHTRSLRDRGVLGLSDGTGCDHSGSRGISSVLSKLDAGQWADFLRKIKAFRAQPAVLGSNVL